MCEVLLIVPPFYKTIYPSCSLSNLKAVLAVKGVRAELIYTNILFEKQIGSTLYEEFSALYGLNRISEYIFAPFAFPGRSAQHKKLEEQIKNDNQILRKIKKISACCADFFDTVSAMVLDMSPALVLCEYFLKELTSSISLLKILKKKNKTLLTALYDHNLLTDASMLIKESVPEIDFIFSGEIESFFPEFAADLAGSAEGPGYVKKKYPRFSVCPPVEDLNRLPYPDFSDYISQYKQHFFVHRLNICFESSRGCSWGEKQKCTFCGYNPAFMAYRSKNPERITAELHYLLDTYGPDNIITTDFIIPPSLVKTGTGLEKRKNCGVNIFYEIKTAVSFNELKRLKKGRVTYVQAGIETLDDHLLGLIHKGTSAALNISFLRNCADLNIPVRWNFLYRIPGEKEEYYRNMLELLPALYHLEPPIELRELKLLRYTPLYNSLVQSNPSKVKPEKFYRTMYPDVPGRDLAALEFETGYSGALIDSRLEDDFKRLVENWILGHNGDSKPELKPAGKDTIYDSREKKQERTYRIGAEHKKLLLLLTEPVSEQNLTGCLEQEVFGELLEKRLIVKAGSRYVSLVTGLK